MKLYYIDGCDVTSLTVDEKETRDIEEGEMKEVIKKMISHIWKPENDVFYIVKYILEQVGGKKEFMFGPAPIYNEIITYIYDYDKENYLALLDIPTEEILLVCYVKCTYTGLTIQERWDNKKHITEKVLKMILKMVDLLDEFADLQQIFCKIMSEFGIVEDSYYCDCCGDTVHSYSLVI